MPQNVVYLKKGDVIAHEGTKFVITELVHTNTDETGKKTFQATVEEVAK